jgi:quercetin dioxygenase-like cupin family protein
MAGESLEGRERVYYRGLENISYGLMTELKKMRELPRVIRGKDLPLDTRDITGPVFWNRWLMEPEMGRMQSIQSHMVDIVPGGRSNKHGHMNEAVFYVIDGKGYDIHDGKRYDYEAGDIIIVHNGCVHQHFNASREKPLKALVIKSKPLFLFMNLLFQKLVEPQPTEPRPGWETWRPTDF